MFSQKTIPINIRHIGKPVVVSDSIPKRINESSGLIFYRHKLWTINDSGDGPFIFIMDTLGKKLLQIITVENAVNIDWEEISQDEKYIYACDFGNNFGHRNHCIIYRIEKSIIPDTGNAKVMSEKIAFTYGNLPKPETGYTRSSFDCEAMISYNDTLVIFSKNWKVALFVIFILFHQNQEIIPLFR